MATKIIRSPRYPQISLRDALDKAAAVYKADHRNKIPKDIVAQHMGYGGLNGASLGVVSAVSKYGLLDGGRDAMWVTQRAVEILEREPGDPERVQALREAATEPDLFRELDDNFPGKVSDSALRSFLVTKREFLPDSAQKLIRAYRETREFVDAETAVGARPGDSGSADAQEVPTDEPRIAEAAGIAVGRSTAVGVGSSITASTTQPDEREWLRGPLSRETSYRILTTGTMGPREIGKLVKLLQAQQAVLEDDYDDTFD